MVATFSTIFLMSGYTVPEANAGVALTMTFDTFCVLTINTATANFGAVSPPTNGTATFNFQNDGNGIQVISADVGPDTTGGMQQSGGIMILPSDMFVNSTTAFDLVGEQTMLNTGTPVQIANLQPLSSTDENNIARQGTIKAETNNLQKNPTTAGLTGTLTLTGGLCS